jgi:hypothetical protein
MATLITKNSSTASSIPTAAQLVQGELAVNVTDKRLFTENSAGAVVELGTNPSSITTGTISATGGVTTSGSISGYGGAEVILAGGSGAQNALSTTATGAPTIAFDHRGTGNTGSFIWRNGTGAANTLAALSSTGLAVTGALSATGALTTVGIKEVSGNVGIGVTSPDRRLHIGSTVHPQLRLVYPGVQTFDIGVTSGGLLGMGSAGTISMALDSAGNLLVGTQSSPAISAGSTGRINALVSSGPVFVASQPASATGFSYVSQSVTSASTGWTHFYGASGNGSTLTTNNIFIYGNGNIVNANNSYGAISDIKLKENITDASPKLAQLNKVRIVNYNLKTEPEHKQLGVVAQELEAIFPGMVEESPDREEQTKTREVEVPAVEEVKDEDGSVTTEASPATTRTEEYTEQVDLGTVTKSVKYSVFVPMLIKAMQEQQSMIEALTARLTALEAA